MLAGCFTTYGQALNNGGPIAISIAWPVICAIILLGVALPMSGVGDADLRWHLLLGIEAGRPTLGLVHGWFNLIGLVVACASVVYVSAIFLVTLLGLMNVDFVFNFSSTNAHYLAHVEFAMFGVILIVHGLINVFRSHPVSLFTNVSVWWHVIGVAVIVVIRSPARRITIGELRLHTHDQQFWGFSGGSTHGGFFCFMCFRSGSC